MPLYMRRVWPIDVGRKYYPESDIINKHKNVDTESSKNDNSNLTNSKEECANRTLANIIRQLADLGNKSQEIFENLENEGNQLHGRVKALSRRITNVAKDVEVMISQSESDSKLVLEDQPQLDGEPWKSTFQNDAGFFTAASRPLAIKQLYNLCEPIPNLNELQAYRTDSESCTKLYSDPEIFFNIWKEALIKETKRLRDQMKMKKTSEKIKNLDRKQVQLQKIKTRREQIIEKERMAGNTLQGPREISQPVSNRNDENLKVDENQDREVVSEDDSSFDEDDEDFFPQPPDEFEEPPEARHPSEPSSPNCEATWESIAKTLNDITFPTDLPPPPPSIPPTPQDGEKYYFPEISLPTPPPPPPQIPLLAPPPPPPPGPMKNDNDGNRNDNSVIGMGALSKQLQQGITLKKVIVNDEKSSELDDRSDLLRSIRCGKQLKKVTVTETKSNLRSRKVNVKNTNNVAELMMHYVDQRYHAIQGSDSSDMEDNDDEMFEDNDFSF